MTTVTRHAPGTFCWFQLATTDEGAAKKFYSKLFDWTDEKTSARGQAFTLVKKHDKVVGAVMPVGPGQGPPSWLPFVSVTNVGQTTARVKAEGGKVLMEPQSIEPNGSFAVFQDPSGGVFAIWEAGTKAGAEIVNETGSVCWNELITTDSRRAGEFYTKIFGWTKEMMPMPGGAPGSYTIFKLDAAQAAGMMDARPEMHLEQSYWMVYFAVDDCDKSAAKTAQLGGKVAMQPTDIPGIGRFAVLQDPQGAYFSIIKPTAPMK